MSNLAEQAYASDNNTFKNNNVFTTSFTITGSTAAGANTKTFTATLPFTPDMVDIVFNGAADSLGNDPRPANGWFKKGYVYVPGTNAPDGYVNYPTGWELYGTISGTTLTVTANFSTTILSVLTLTSTSFSVRLVDYSVF